MRLALVELLALRLHNALAAGPGRPLSTRERQLARAVFGGALDLDPVRIVETRAIHAPTVLGNTIRMEPGMAMDARTLIHELTHVWQYQTRGGAYISDSLWHQGRAWWQTGSRNAAYQVTLATGRSIFDYTAEQQAVIVEDAFADPEGFGSDPDVVRMMDEVRSSHVVRD